MLFFIIRLFAGWRYAGRIFNAGICRGKAISEFRSPNALPRAPTPLGTEGVLRCCVCCVVDFCLYASVLDVERCADLVPVFFGVGRGTLCRFIFIYCVFWALGRMYIRFYSLLSAVEFSAGDVATVWAAAKEV